MLSKKFRRVYVEITGFCGLSCPFCPPKTRTSLKISQQQFSLICTQLSAITSELSLHLMGDPLSIDDLEGYLDIATMCNLGINITTSGIFIARHAEILKTHKAIRQINFSLNSFQGLNASKDFRSYIEPIFRFCLETSIDADRFVNLRLWNGTGAKEDEKFRETAIGLIENFFKITINTRSRRFRVAPKVIVDFDDYFDWPSQEGGTIKNGFCLGLSDHFGILSDGTVVPCCLDYAGHVRLGNAFEDDILDILSSHRSVAIQNGFTKKIAVEELCQKCSYRSRFL